MRTFIVCFLGLQGKMKLVYENQVTTIHNKKTDHMLVTPDIILEDSRIQKTQMDHFLCMADIIVQGCSN